MIFEVITIFPRMLDSPLAEGVLKKAIDKGLLTVRVHDLRDFTDDPYRTTDDSPYGGGGGMVMTPEPFARAVESLQKENPRGRVILLTPQGGLFTQERARALAREGRLILLCGRYEGVDERVREIYVDEEISVGDYVLTGGELPALVVIDAVARMIPGVLGCARSAEEDSFADGLLDFPHYTRPEVFRGSRVPAVLLSGDHGAIRRWRRRQALLRTAERRPDLIREEGLSEEERGWLAEWRRENADGRTGADAPEGRLARHERDR
ncbi:MAG: tRNA (guanosine(37)-N1)-methyltransferase TrmD [Candidatus Tectomicrobia bacterium]|nr:tRNA (guanosine(37)-N1)-methyltransferase TrmD [Candidatus Tectomicrobia bacterium]